MLSLCCNASMSMEGNGYPPKYRCCKCGKVYLVEKKLVDTYHVYSLVEEKK